MYLTWYDSSHQSVARRTIKIYTHSDHCHACSKNQKSKMMLSGKTSPTRNLIVHRHIDITATTKSPKLREYAVLRFRKE